MKKKVTSVMLWGVCLEIYLEEVIVKSDFFDIGTCVKKRFPLRYAYSFLRFASCFLHFEFSFLLLVSRKNECTEYPLQNSAIYIALSSIPAKNWRKLLTKKQKADNRIARCTR